MPIGGEPHGSVPIAENVLSWHGNPYSPYTAADELENSTGYLNIIVPVVSMAYDEPLLRKKRAFSVRQGTRPFMQLPVYGPDGNPVDLTKYGLWTDNGIDYVEYAIYNHEGSLSDMTGIPHVKVRFREASLVDKTIYQVYAAVLDAANGIIMCEIPPQVCDATGIYLVEMAPIDIYGFPVFTNECYCFVEHSAWGGGFEGPPTVDDMRLSLRDSDPLENELIENYDFGLVELCYAAVRTVNFWNTQPPRIAAAVWSTTRFRDREIWLTGTHLFLFEMAEEHYRRNRLPYSAGGVQVDDKAKSPEYNKAWQERFQRFKQLIMHNKAQINMAQGYGMFSGGFGRWGW